MRAERFGSYSIVETVAGMSRLSRLKSMMRYIRLWPPPPHQDVSSPRLFRPPERCSGSTRGLCGWSVVISSNTCTVWNRWPGVVGLYLWIAIMRRLLCALEKFRLLRSLGQTAVRLFPVRSTPGEAALPLHLAMRNGRADTRDLRAEQLLDRVPDFGFVRVGRDVEHDRPSIFAQD